MQNTTETEFVILGVSTVVPKTTMLTTISVSAFLLGVLVSWPRRKKIKSSHDFESSSEQQDNSKRNNSTLSDEDRDYIS
jgi:hypothetical protein